MKKRIVAILLTVTVMLTTGCNKKEVVIDSMNNGIVIEKVSENVYKTAENANPLSTNIFCADPTGVEYNGRLYVYGTNDQQQADNSDHNDYVHIKSLVCFSTDDMVNWTYHGTIDVGEISPWIYNSWAPSVCSRVEEDGKTHFYLYYSNSGNGVGVLTATDPTGPWTDPLGKPLIYQEMPGLENCPAPFDPGVCIDENGVGWLSFGGGAPAAEEGIVHTNIPKVIKLGEDMISIDSDFVSIDAPYFFEASELNYIDGTFYYSYSTDWQQRSVSKGWEYDGIPLPPTCSMAYLTTKTPLDAKSWEYRGAFFYNSGQSGMRWGNNHTHFMEYQGKNYILHHTMLLEELKGTENGFRSLMVDYLPLDKETGEISLVPATRAGVEQIKAFDPYLENSGAAMFTCADVSFTEGRNPASKSDADGAWIYVKKADFKDGANEFTAKVKGKGRIEIRLDDLSSEALTFIEFDCEEYTKVRSVEFSEFEKGEHDIYIVFSGEGIELSSWQFSNVPETENAQ